MSSSGSPLTRPALFHSFPRDTEADRAPFVAAAILRRVLSCGLLLIPEEIAFPGELVEGGIFLPPVRIWQRRFSLTAINRSELLVHCAKFGDWSLEFSLGAAQVLGAIPVVYIPSSNAGTPGSVAAFGAFMVHRLHEIQCVLEGLINVESTSFWDSIKKLLPDDRVEFPQLAASIQSLAGLFYHVSRHGSSDSTYYQQREWRILSQVVESSSQAHCRKLSKTEIEQLQDLMPVFRKRVQTKTLNASYAEEALLLETVNGLPISELISCLHVPHDDFDLAKAVAAECGCIHLPIRKYKKVN